MNKYIDGLVSVVIPTYKRSDMLCRAVDSVRNQTYSNLEILVVDDNIRGDEYAVELRHKLEKYKDDRRVKLVTQEVHINGAAARNAGIREAKGEYLAFLDDDDWWEPEKIACQVEYLKQLDESWGGVGCLMRHYKHDKLIYVSLPYREGNIRKEVMCRQIGIGTGSPLMRRAAVDDAGFFDEKLSRHQDIQFFSFFCDKYKMGLVKKYLYDYDLGDAQNRPAPETIRKIKEKYYVSVAPIIDKMSKTERKHFQIMNNFEIGCVFFKNKQYRKALPNILKVFSTFYTMKSACSRVIIRWLGAKFAEYFEKKYA